MAGAAAGKSTRREAHKTFNDALAKKCDIPSFRRRPEVSKRSETPIQCFSVVVERLDIGFYRGDDFVRDHRSIITGRAHRALELKK